MHISSIPDLPCVFFLCFFSSKHNFISSLGQSHHLKQAGLILKQMASVRSDQNPGLPANCSDMSDMLVCLVTPHSSTATKVEPTPPLEHQAQVACKDVRRDGAPVWRPRVHPPPVLLLERPHSPHSQPRTSPHPPESEWPYNPSSIPSLNSQPLQSTPSAAPSTAVALKLFGARNLPSK